MNITKNVNKELSEIINADIEETNKLTEIADLLFDGQNKTEKIIKQGFVGVALQNKELIQQNDALKEQLQFLENKVDKVTKQLQQKIDQEQLLQEKRLHRKNRKRLPNREPITKEIYQFLIKESYDLPYSTSFRGARLRLGLALLLVTGIRIGELLTVKIWQVKTLFSKSWIAIDRKKRGPSNHKAFLTTEGKKIIQDRREDFNFICHSKNEDSYIFTAENVEKPLKLEAFNRIINHFLKKSAEKLAEKPNLKSHSFRIGFITQLWRDTKDIEFVRQAIGHKELSTTSQYIALLSENERQDRMLKINPNHDD